MTWTPCEFPSTVTDVCDLGALVEAFAGIDTVVHLAAAATLDARWEETSANSISGTRNVYEAAKITGVRRVVFASSGHVTGLAEERAGADLYSLAAPRVFDESTLCEPDSLYAVPKVYREAMGRY